MTKYNCISPRAKQQPLASIFSPSQTPALTTTANLYVQHSTSLNIAPSPANTPRSATPKKFPGQWLAPGSSQIRNPAISIAD